VNEAPPAAITLDVGVRGMTCAACVGRVERALGTVPGVEGARVNLATERATLSLGPGARVADALAAIERRGYTPALGTVAVSAVDARADAVRAALDHPAVLDSTERDGLLEVRFVPAALSRGELLARLEGAGARDADTVRDDDDSDEKAREREEAALRRDVRLALVLAVPLFVVGMGHMAVPALEQWLHDTIGHFALMAGMFVLATPVVFGPGLRFLRPGTKALVAGTPDMNSLVTLGTVAAWAYSTVATFAPAWLPEGAAHVYYEAAAVVIALVLVGRLLEHRAKGSARAALDALGRLMPARVRVLRAGQVVELAATMLQPDDIVRVGPGEVVAVDGIVVAGRSELDEAALTGESVPVARGEGDEVAAGTTNLMAQVDVRATRVGGGTTVSRIAAAVTRAQAARADVQRVADRVIAVFVPIVLVVAALTVFAWMSVLGPSGLGEALSRAVAVLVVACPCALGLATPISIVVASGRAAQLGVVIADGAALERLAACDTAAFDKTGTLTEGAPRVAAVETLAQLDENELIAWAAAAESTSAHPLARALAACAHERGVVVAVADTHALEPGRGVTATVSGRTVRVGSEAWLAPGEERAPLAPGATHVAVEVDGVLAGRLALVDPLRADAAATVAALRAEGLRAVLLSGDEIGAVAAVAQLVGADEHTARCTPEQKAEQVRSAQAAGRRVVFVGDGVNDAPALAEASVGVALGTGTDVAIGAAHVVIVSGALRLLVVARALSAATMTNIRWNLVWAFGYNVLLIPLAAGALVPIWPGSALSPVLAGAAMALSSVFVVGNALRLRSFEAPT
jgi:Cu+-exporting ATPase